MNPHPEPVRVGRAAAPRPPWRERTHDGNAELRAVADRTWVWTLSPTTTGGTRRVISIRAVYDWRHPLAGLITRVLMKFGDFATLRWMLCGIKTRAEHTSRA